MKQWWAALALATVGAAQVGWWVGENAPRTQLDELTRCYQDLSPRPEAMAHRLLAMGPEVTERALAACRRVIE